MNLLIEQYRLHGADQPAGVAVARAAINWQRAGMPPGSISEPMLRDLARLTLATIAPNRIMDDQTFQAGLAWATTEVAAFAALVRREPDDGSGPRRFRAFDAVVSWAHEHEPPLGGQLWQFVIDNADGVDQLGVGVAAYRAAQYETAISAFQRAAASDASPTVAEALFDLGVVLGELGRSEDELAAYDQVIARYGDIDSPALAEQVAMALVGIRLARSERPTT